MIGYHGQNKSALSRFQTALEKKLRLDEKQGGLQLAHYNSDVGGTDQIPVKKLIPHRHAHLKPEQTRIAHRHAQLIKK